MLIFYLTMSQNKKFTGTSRYFMDIASDFTNMRFKIAVMSFRI